MQLITLLCSLISVVCVASLRDFTPEQLLKYNGVDNDSIYVARYGIVYDVSTLSFPPETFGKDIAKLSVEVIFTSVKVAVLNYLCLDPPSQIECVIPRKRGWTFKYPTHEQKIYRGGTCSLLRICSDNSW